MIGDLLESCPDCGESKKSKLTNTPIWFECKTCGYSEDSFKGPAMLSRRHDPQGPLVQYL